MIEENTLRAWALEMGFGEMALCSAADFVQERIAVERQVSIAERRQLRFYPVEDSPQTRSLAVLLWPYAPAAIAGGGRVFVDSYYFASNAAYHAARALQDRVLESGGFAKANVSYPAREAAVRAGMGLIGRNGLLISPRFGTRTVIILMATDIPLGKEKAPQEGGDCLRCGRCARACPAGAIDERGMSHPERCLRNFMMEGVVAPEPLRRKMGMRLIGCDICQRVCPMQPRMASAKDEGFSLDMFMTADDGAFSKSVAALADQIGRNAARPQRVRAQAALLAGNRKSSADLPVLREWAKSSFPAVRTHALWAIKQIEGGDKTARNTNSGT